MVQAGKEAGLLPTRSLRWQEAARSVGALYEAGDFWSPERLVLACPPWTIALHAESIDAPLTLVSADVSGCYYLRVTLLHGEFSRLWAGIDLAPLEVGGPAFFSQVQLTASNSRAARALFARPGLRQKLLGFPHLALDLRRGKLRLAVPGIIDDPEALIELFAIGVEVLQTAQALG